MSTFHPYTVDLENGNIGPAWSLEVAVQAAREAETVGCKAVRIRRGAEVILEGAALRTELDS